MSKILNFLFTHYVGMFLAGVVLVSTNAQAYPSGPVVASVESPENQPAQASPSPTAEAPKQTPQTETRDPATVKPSHHLSTEARIIHELNRHGIDR